MIKIKSKTFMPIYAFYKKQVCNEIELMFSNGLVENKILAIPQWKVGNRRIDFALVGTYSSIKFIDAERLKIAIEIDGSEYHTGLENIKKDNQRDLELKQQGWKVYHLTGQDVYHDLDKCILFVKKLLDKQ